MSILDKTRFEFENRLIERTIISSSNILGTDYDLMNKQLTVYFKYKDSNTYTSAYRYENVNVKLYSDFLNADSQGRFLQNSIKPKQECKFEKVTPPFETAKPIIEIESRYKDLIKK